MSNGNTIETKRLYCGNIPFSSTADDLREFFNGRGFTVTECVVVTDRDTGKSKGFGFVEVDAAQARAAIDDLNDEDFDGRRIQVSEATSKPRTGGGDRGRGGRPERRDDRGGERRGRGERRH